MFSLQSPAVMHTRLPFFLVLPVLFAGLTACSVQRPPRAAGPTGGTYCTPPRPLTDDVRFRPLPDTDPALRAEGALAGFSEHDRLLANATGLVPLLRQRYRLRADSSTAGQLSRLGLDQQLSQRLQLVSTQLTSLAAELDCEGERADQLARALDERDSRRIRRLTIGSAVLGAITTVATAFIARDGVNKSLDIAGGLISTGLGVAAAVNTRQTVSFAHARNLLTDIWTEQTQSDLYPPAVWYVLHHPAFSNSARQTIAHNIRARWIGYELADAAPADRALYFGAGGPYRADALHVRANMLNQLQSSIWSISQDLQSLQQQLIQQP